MRIITGLVIITAALACISGPAQAAGPSFDCAKARAPVEKLLCANGVLGDLDKALADAFETLQSHQPTAAKTLIADEQRWLGERDKNCPAEAQNAVPCLSKLYEDRIAGLKAKASASAALCSGIAQAYQKTLGQSEFGNSGDFLTANVLDRLNADRATGVILAKPLADSLADAAALRAFVLKAHPGLKFSPDVSKALDELSDGTIALIALPDTPVLAGLQTQGTMNCTYAVPFDISKASTMAIDPPPNWGSDDCMTKAAFGSFKGAPVAYTDGTNAGPELTDRVTASPWAGDGFGDFCAVSFRYAPVFDDRPINPPDPNCKELACDALKETALQLAQNVHANPAKARADALAVLAPDERKAFAAVQVGDTGDDPARGKSEEILDQNPLRFAVKVQGTLYRVSIGHATIGWRTYADWSVIFERIEKRRLGKSAEFGVGMHKGKLIATTFE